MVDGRVDATFRACTALPIMFPTPPTPLLLSALPGQDHTADPGGRHPGGAGAVRYRGKPAHVQAHPRRGVPQGAGHAAGHAGHAGRACACGVSAPWAGPQPAQDPLACCAHLAAAWPWFQRVSCPGRHVERGGLCCCFSQPDGKVQLRWARSPRPPRLAGLRRCHVQPQGGG